MLMDELIRTCANAKVAEAAVSSLGRNVCSEIEKAAAHHELSTGEFVAGAVDRFARSGDEGTMRAVASAMRQSHEPILAGLQTILFHAFASEAKAARQSAYTVAGVPAYICNVEGRLRREALGY